MPERAEASAMVRVEVLGDLRVLREDRALVLPPSRRTRALLGYLAVTGRPQLRGRLCDLLWDGPGDPRAALRWSLAKLRPLVDPGRPRLLTEGDAVALTLAPGELDVADVRALLDGGVDAAGAERLRRAAAAFRGELLEGLELPGCWRFEEWAAAERAALRRLRLSILDGLVARFRDSEPEEALVHARARVAIDPLAEAGHAAVIRLLGRLGRTKEGLAQYDGCREMLASALGAKPSAELEHARRSLTAPRTPSPAGRPARAPRPAPPAASPGPPFVGRAAELATLERLVADVRAGSDRVLVVEGEPGVGKSRLLDELAARFVRAGGQVMRGRAYEAEMLRPYAAWLEALRGAPLAALDPLQQAELAPLLPELGPPAPASDEGRLFDAVVRALATLAAARPLLVVLDDAQWLDERSSALLHAAARALRGAPVLLACAARAAELADNPATLRVTRALARADAATRLALGPLAAGEVAALARSVDPGLDAARLHAESEGNPLLALELARALRAGGEPTRSLDLLLAERLERVAGPARELLAWAAALGRSFRAERLAHVAGLPAPELLRGIDELERRGLLRPAGEGTYDFAHDLVRRAAYRAVSAPRRQLLHRAVARALASSPDPDGALAGEVAHHAALGDDAELAVHAAIAAAGRAARLFACAEARGLVERALGFATRFPPQARISASLALLRVAVDASRTGGGDPGLVPRIQALVDEARAHGFGGEEAAGLGVLAHAHYASRDTGHAGELLERQPPKEPDGAVALCEVAGCLALLERDLPRARLLVEEGRRLGHVPPRAAVYLATAAGVIHALDGELDDAVRSFEEALLLAPAGAPWEENTLLSRLALVELARGRPERAIACAARMEVAGPRLGATGEELVPAALRTVARRVEGEPVPDAQLLAALAPLELDSGARFAELCCALAEGELARGRAEPCRSLLRRAVAAAERVARPSLVVRARALHARATSATGEAPDRAAHHAG
jgi:DNA-binding SARP family transcriptional activator